MQRKLIFLVHGGLGNQLFQYAAGLYAEKRWGIPVDFCSLVPREDKKKEHPRQFMLNRFAIHRPVKHAGFIWRKSMLGSRFLSLKHTIHSVLGISVVDETSLYRLDPEFEKEPHHRKTVFRGYWQSIEYIREIEAPLRAELQIRGQAEWANAKMISMIKAQSCSVSLHIRRGDYTGISGGSIILPLEYYQSAIRRMAASHPDGRFFVFSDDLNWAVDHLPKDAPCIFVEGNSQNEAHEDLRLMAACKHHIIANSSFSWWGAWLNPDPEKKVIMPKYWMGHELTALGLIPEGWETIWTV